MPGNQIPCEGAIIGENINDLSISELVAGHHILAIHLGANHMVAHVCVYVIRKVQHSSALQIHFKSCQLASNT